MLTLTCVSLSTPADSWRHVWANFPQYLWNSVLKINDSCCIRCCEMRVCFDAWQFMRSCCLGTVTDRQLQRTPLLPHSTGSSARAGFSLPDAQFRAHSQKLLLLLESKGKLAPLSLSRTNVGLCTETLQSSGFAVLCKTNGFS